MESNRRINIIALHYNFYYYTSSGDFRLNTKTFLMYGSMLASIPMIFDAELFYREGKYLELMVTSGLFISLLIIIRWLNGKRN